MSDARAALVIKSIVQEVVAVCAEGGHTEVDEPLASFMVKCVVLDPTSPYSDDLNLTKEDVAALVNACVERLTASGSMPLATIKMQLTFQRKYASLGDVKSFYVQQRLGRYERIEADIVSAAPTSVQEEIEELYSKIIESNLLRTNMGAQSDFNVIRESTAALESVLPPIELGVFMSLTQKEKRQQLEDLSLIVGGIRLFNKFTGKGGKEITDHATGVVGKVGSLLQRSHDDLCKFSQLAGVFAVCQTARSDAATSFVEAAANAQQYQTYLAILHKDMVMLAERAGAACTAYTSRQNLLLTTIQSKTAVPTDQVYPQFIELADLYTTLDIVNTSLDRISALQNELSALMQVLVRFVDSNHAALLDANAKQDGDMLRVYADFVNAIHTQSVAALQVLPDLGGDRATIPNPETLSSGPAPPALLLDTVQSAGARGAMLMILPGVTHNYEAIPLNLGGLCAHSAALEPPQLRQADRNLGLIQYEDRFYGFTNQEAASAFAADIDGSLDRILHNAKKFPELLELLQLHEHFSSIAPDSDNGIAMPKANKKALKCDGGCQTEVHPVESNWVQHYDHSEWELRRKAIKLANLRNKKTHSVQTDRSNYRREVSTQVYVPKVSSTQTRKSQGTSVPKPVIYVRGLRGPHGRKAKKVEVVDLTTDIGGMALSIRGLTGSKTSR